MRHTSWFVRCSLSLILGASMFAAACATPTTEESGGGGSGATSSDGGGGRGTGGSGGAECVAEICDGVDNNCDGVVDEGCECLAGETEPCYSGPEGTEGVGTCKAGIRECDATTNKFGLCMGEVLPAETEACDGKDENCNGTADEGIPDIGCGFGTCAVEVAGCVDGAPNICTPLEPTLEVCDGLDNDCDQLVDDSFPENGMACNSGMPGICSAGMMVCMGGVLSCAPNLMPTNETCDDLDNDCDGTVDNNIPGTGGACGTGQLGVCSAGTIACQGGVVDCFPNIPSSNEICDGLDNNCDGTVDENNPEGGGACDTGLVGACQPGTINCVMGALSCTPNTMSQPETCDNIDNNCNGATDEGNPGAGQACSCGGTTVCNVGVLKCQGCTKEVDCNNSIDDDGDGQIDCADSQCALGCNAQVGPCGPGQKLLVLSSTDVPKTIPDNTTISSTMVFSETSLVKRASVFLNITHTFDGDLTLTLKAPNNATVILSDGNGSSGDNYSQTIFNDGCPAVTGGAPPYTGCFGPEQPLLGLANVPVNGTWTLQVTDSATIDTGTLTAWTLALCVE